MAHDQEREALRAEFIKLAKAKKFDTAMEYGEFVNSYIRYAFEGFALGRSSAPQREACTTEPTQISRFELTQFLNEFCGHSANLQACVESAFYAFNKSLLQRASPTPPQAPPTGEAK